MEGTSWRDLATPAALVDLDRAERNASAMRARAAAHGVALRPHVKTHKTVEGALLEHGGAHGPITVSTVAEAEFFAAAGFRDITYAVSIAPVLLPRLAALAPRVDRLSLLVDHADALEAVRACARAAGWRAPVFLEVDCGGGRAGVDPRGARALELGKALADAPEIEFRGLLTHAGQAYRCRDRAAARAVAAEERDAVVALALRLRALGVACPDVSVGSTPTMVAADDLSGVTEIRPGNYLFFDGFQAAIGSCAQDEIAFSVAASVIGVREDAVIVNAGALALSKDEGARHVDPGAGYGRVGDGARVVALTQEHGVVRGPGVEQLRLGDAVRIVPNHACLAAACFDRYHVVRGDRIVAAWRPCRGW